MPKAMLVSVPAEASKVQVIAAPEPKVAVPISVASKLRVTVRPTSAVSMPFVPPAIVTV